MFVFRNSDFFIYFDLKYFVYFQNLKYLIHLLNSLNAYSLKFLVSNLDYYFVKH